MCVLCMCVVYVCEVCAFIFARLFTNRKGKKQKLGKPLGWSFLIIREEKILQNVCLDNCKYTARPALEAKRRGKNKKNEVRRKRGEAHTHTHTHNTTHTLRCTNPKRREGLSQKTKPCSRHSGTQLPSAAPKMICRRRCNE